MKYVETEIESEKVRKVGIVNGIAVVNRVDIKKKGIRNCAEFHEVRVVFACYKSNSLKGNTRTVRTKRCPSIHHKVSESTRIEHQRVLILN